AGIGGADAITVLPFTAALGLPDAFARRVARNTQLILLDESNLARVADPAAGAGGFEALTDALCEKTWGLFQEIEREGGILESLKGETLQGRIAAVRAQREKAVATRREPITGTSEFPNINEADVTILMPMPAVTDSTGSAPQGAAASTETSFASLVQMAADGATLPQLAITAAGSSAVAVAPLPSIRVAEAFERLRDISDAYRARTGARPKVFLANLGSIADFTARATFAKNFFEAGGIESVMNEGLTNQNSLREAFSASKAKISCICSTDDIYKLHAPATARTLHEAGSKLIFLAGRPGEDQKELAGAGITSFIFSGCDTLKVLGEALDKACAEA
ncbi:MAG: methylmalonyl-CoA mutase, partial [Microvirga sp.]|nr:methylmalonyl-CoA mutase [Microvirga sp.]